MRVGGFPVRFRRVPFVARMPRGFKNPCWKVLRVLVAGRGLSRRVVCGSDPCRRWDPRSEAARLYALDSCAPPRPSVKTLSCGNYFGLSAGVRVMALIELKFTRSAGRFGVVRDLDERAVVSVAFGCSSGLAGELAVSRRIRGPLTDRLGLRSKIKGRLILAQIQTRPSLGSQPSVHLIKANLMGEQKNPKLTDASFGLAPNVRRRDLPESNSFPELADAATDQAETDERSAEEGQGRAGIGRPADGSVHAGRAGGGVSDRGPLSDVVGAGRIGDVA